MKTFLKNALLCVLLLSVQIFATDTWLSQTELDTYIEKAMKDWDVPGLAMAIVQDGNVISAKGYGVLKVGESESVDANTMFAIGSCTKAFTAAAWGMLVDEGKVSWDSKPSEYLANFELCDPFITRELTVRDMLAHRTGLDRADGIWLGGVLSREELLYRMRFLKPLNSFRSQFTYNNLMYLAAGEMIPAVTGISWDDFVMQRIFTPLGMERTFTNLETFANLDNVAAPHHKTKTELKPIAWRNINCVGPAGSISTCANDMAKWVMLMLNKGSFNGVSLIKEETVTEIQTPQSIMGPKNIVSPHNYNLYGFGWVLQDYAGYQMVQHGGAIDGMHAHVAMIPEKNFGLVILTNMDMRPITSAITYHLCDLMLENPAPKDWNSNLLTVWKQVESQINAMELKKEKDRNKETSPTLELNKYEGVFHNDLYGDIFIAAMGDGLICRAELTNGSLDHWEDDTFVFDAEKNGIPFPFKTYYKFVVKNGQVDSIKVSSSMGWIVLSDEVFERR